MNSIVLLRAICLASAVIALRAAPGSTAGRPVLSAASERLGQPIVRVNVFSHDRRRELKEATAPWSAIGRIVVNSTIACTAATIGPDLLLTNAHCILEALPLANGTRDINKGNITFFAATNRSAAIAQASVNKIWLGTFHEDDAAHDWAILQTDWRIGDQVGWLEMSGATTDRILKLTETSVLHIVSYPSDLGRTEVPFIEQGCKFTGRIPELPLFMHNCSTSGGASGAPMFIFEGGADAKQKPGIVALHAKDIQIGANTPAVGVAYSDDVANIAVPADAWRSALALIATGGNTDAVHAAAHMNAGRKYQQQARHDLAVAEFSEAIAIDPTAPAGYHFRGISHGANGDSARAMTDFTRSIEIQPAHAPAYIDRGTALLDKRDFANALADYSRAIEVDPTNPDFYLARGRAYGRQLDFDRAIADFTRAIELAPGRADAYYERGKRHLNRGQVESAVLDFSKALEIDPRLASALIDRGKAKEENGDWDGAISDYSKAIDIAPAAFVYDNRGIANSSSGKRDEAIADFAKAIELDPTYVSAIVHLGNEYQKQGALARAASEYARAIKINPKYTFAYLGLGRVELKSGRLDQAIIAYSKGIELSPRSSLFFSSRGAAYRIKGDVDRAMADYTKAVELNPDNADVVRSLGVLQFIKGDFKAAASSFAASIALADNPYALLWRYLALARQRVDAVAELETNARYLQTSDWPFFLIEVYLGRRSPALVAEAATTAAARCEAYFYVGQWHILKGNIKEAAIALNAAAKGCPHDFIEYIGAVGELKRLKP